VAKCAAGWPIHARQGDGHHRYASQSRLRPLQILALHQAVSVYLFVGTTLTDQNCIHEEIKSRLNSGNACYHSVQSILSSRLLSKNVKVKIYKTIILPVVLYGCETWSLTLRE
jgi:hypothetical protein